MLGALGRSLTLRTFNKDTSQSGVPRGGGPSQATAAALREAMDEGSDSDSDEEDKVVAAGGKGSYAHMRERLEIEYDEKLHTSLEATTGVETEESRLDETKDDRFTVHPLAPTLGPWQRKLAQLLKQVRIRGSRSPVLATAFAHRARKPLHLHTARATALFLSQWRAHGVCSRSATSGACSRGKTPT